MIYNNLTKLYEELLNNINLRKTTENPFGNLIKVIVPNKNVGSTLQTKLADEKGVAVRVLFVTKDEFINSSLNKYKKEHVGFSKKRLRYYILNMLENKRISKDLSFYYKDSSMKKYNYAKDLEKHFIHYQNYNLEILKELSNYNLGDEIKTPFELQAFIYQEIKEKGFITLDEAINKVIKTDEEIHLIYDNTESELFNNLISKYPNVCRYLFEGEINNKKIDLFTNWSKIRELETVFDYITNELETTNILPKDILVLFPNVNEYITSINYVFSKKINNYYNYKYSISNYVNEIEVYKQFLTKLRLETNYRLEASKMFDLFNLSIKLKKLNYNKADLDLVKDWINDNAIRSDFVAGKKGFDFSWDKGFEQLILGMMMESDSFNHFGNYSSKDISLNEYHLFEELYTFIKMIKKISNTKCKNLEELNSLMIEALTTFFGEEEKEDSITTKVFNLWIDIINNELSILDEMPTIKVVLKILEERVTLFKDQYTILGGINFGSIEEFNLVDAKLKIVCGLDDMSYPFIETDSILNLDKEKSLIKIKHQETMFKNLIYNNGRVVLSYVGFNEANRKKINRSVFIDLFIKDQVKEIVHKLQPFDDIYLYQENKDYYTYDLRYSENQKLVKKDPFIKNELERISIYKNVNDLKRILKSPVRNWFRNALKLSFPEDEETLDNSPLYYLGSKERLEQAIIKRSFLEDYLDKEKKEIKKLKNRGIIPYDRFGKYYLNSFEKMFDNVSDIFTNKEKYQLIENLNIIYKDYFFNISQIYYNKEDDNYLIITPDTIKDKYYIQSKKRTFSYEFMFQRYLFEAILIKLHLNKDLYLLGFNEDNELIMYHKDIFEILNINCKDDEKINALDETLDYLWSFKDVLESNLYLYDMKSASDLKNKWFGIYNILNDVINSSFTSGDKGIDDFINNLIKLESVLSKEKNTRKSYLKEIDSFNDESLKEIVELINEIDKYLNEYIEKYGSDKRGLKSYDLNFEYLLEDVSSATDFINKYGLKVLVESFLLNYKLGEVAIFDTFDE